jgi:hypothetical protein
MPAHQNSIYPKDWTITPKSLQLSIPPPMIATFTAMAGGRG